MREPYRNDASNALGKSDASRTDSTSPPRFASTISISPQNSHSICLQAPHGGVSFTVSAATAIRRNLRAPSDNALNTATRSAQSVSPKVAFSMLHPVNICPFSSSRAAPTLNLENGAWAFSREAMASEMSALFMSGQTRNHGLQQRGERIAHALAGRQHLGMIEFLVTHARGIVGDARDSENLQPHMI